MQKLQMLACSALQILSMESGVSGNHVSSVSMFETLTTLPESIHFVTFG